MLTIVFKDGDHTTYDKNEYTEYRYYKEVFVVIYKKQWIGIYSMDIVKAVEVEIK